MDISIGWLHAEHYPEVLRIEQACFSRAWTEEDFRRCIKRQNGFGLVAEFRQRVVGFSIYETEETEIRMIRILNFAVIPLFRWQGVGTAMVQELKSKLDQQRRKEILLEVRESNLAAQLFFKAQGFRAVRVLRDHYECTAEDAYAMRYRIADDDRAPQFSLTNRISSFAEEFAE